MYLPTQAAKTALFAAGTGADVRQSEPESRLWLAPLKGPQAAFSNRTSGRWRLLRHESVLVRPQRARGAVEHGVHELETIGGAEALGERHRLVDRHAVWHLRPRRKLVDRDQQHRTLNRTDPAWCTIGEGSEPRIEFLAPAPHALDQRAEVLAIGARHVLRLAEFLYEVLPWRVVQLPAVERLQCQLARHAARA